MKLDFDSMGSVGGSGKKKNSEVVSGYEKRIELFEKAEALAKELYGNIPYHNFEHACEAVESGYEIVAKCEASDVPVDSDIVRYALLFHDAGYHEDHEKEGFNSKEEYSAHLAGEALRSLDMPTATIENVQKCIISTHKDKEFNVLEEKIVRAADLAGLASEYEQFKKNAIKLKVEAEIISGDEISWEDWKNGVNNIIEFYLRQDIKLTECYLDKNGESVFHNIAKKNLKRFISEDISDLKK